MRKDQPWQGAVDAELGIDREQSDGPDDQRQGEWSQQQHLKRQAIAGLAAHEAEGGKARKTHGDGGREYAEDGADPEAALVFAVVERFLEPAQRIGARREAEDIAAVEGRKDQYEDRREQEEQDGEHAGEQQRLAEASCHEALPRRREISAPTRPARARNISMTMPSAEAKGPSSTMAAC